MDMDKLTYRSKMFLLSFFAILLQSGQIIGACANCKPKYCSSADKCTECYSGYRVERYTCVLCKNNCGECRLTEHKPCKSCRHGYYGKDCMSLCPRDCFKSICRRLDGVCSYNCSTGETGNVCKCVDELTCGDDIFHLDPANPGSSRLPVIVICTVVAVAVVVVVVVIGFILIRNAIGRSDAPAAKVESAIQPDHTNYNTQTQTVRSERPLTDRHPGSPPARAQDELVGSLGTDEALPEMGREPSGIHTSIDDVSSKFDRENVSGIATLSFLVTFQCQHENMSGTAKPLSRGNFQVPDLAVSIAPAADKYKHESLRRDDQTGSLYSRVENDIVSTQRSKGPGNVGIPSEVSVDEITESDEYESSCLPSGQYQPLPARLGTSAVYTSLQGASGDETA